MKINKIQHHTLRNSVLALAIIAVAVGGFYVYARLANDSTVDTPIRPTNSISYDKATTDQQKAGIESKKQALNESQSSASDTTASRTTNISITSVNQNGNILSIRTIIDSTKPEGLCKLTLEKTNSTPVAQEAFTQVTGSYSVCKGFDMPTDSLDKGDWKIKITYTSSESSGSVEKAITVN